MFGGVYIKKVCIFFFSGTGMTKYIVNKIKIEYEKQHICADCVSIDNPKLRDIRLASYETVGIVYPVHSFNAPQIVINFVKHLPKTNRMNAFIISTAGEDHPINYASSDLLIKILRAKGFHVFYNKLFAMPSNFIIKYEDTKVKQIIDEAKKKYRLQCMA